MVGAALMSPFFVTPAVRAQTGVAGGKAADPLSDGKPVIGDDALYTAPLSGAERTDATRDVYSSRGGGRFARFTIKKSAAETNATQLILPITAPVEKGDALVARFYLAGGATGSNKPATITLGFEKSVDPWTKSLSEAVHSIKRKASGGLTWKPFVFAFTAAESYQSGEAMVTLRLAHGPQEVLVSALSVVNLGKIKSGDDLSALIADQTPLGKATVRVNLKDEWQTMVGLGGNFARAMYADDANDATGRYLLEALKPVHARVAIPLPQWEPLNDNPDPNRADANGFKDEGRAHSALLLLQDLHRRGIKELVASAWDVPDWLVEDAGKKSQRRIPKENYAEAAECFAQFLVTARDKYGVTVSYVSFNESDYGVQILFTPAELAAFIKVAGPRFKALGLPTKWLVGDTTGGQALVAFARPQLEDAECRPFLGPVAFHGWDALAASPDDYRAIAALAQKYNRPVWCLEAGWDSGAWRMDPAPWPTWNNALKLAQVNARVVGDAGAQIVDYWQYQRDYPVVDVAEDGKVTPYPVFTVIQQMAKGLPRGARVVAATSDKDDLQVIATRLPGGFMSVQLVNRAGAGTVTITGLAPQTPLTLTQTTRTQRMISPRRFYTTDKNGVVTVPVAPLSVTLLSASATKTAVVKRGR